MIDPRDKMWDLLLKTSYQLRLPLAIDLVSKPHIVRLISGHYEFHYLLIKGFTKIPVEIIEPPKIITRRWIYQQQGKQSRYYLHELRRS